MKKKASFILLISFVVCLGLVCNKNNSFAESGSTGCDGFIKMMHNLAPTHIIQLEDSIKTINTTLACACSKSIKRQLLKNCKDNSTSNDEVDKCNSAIYYISECQNVYKRPLSGDSQW